MPGGMSAEPGIADDDVSALWRGGDLPRGESSDSALSMSRVGESGGRGSSLPVLMMRGR